MAKLYFRYGAMNSGKSTFLLTAAYNYTERDKRVLIAKPAIDTKSDRVSSRIGIEGKVDWHLNRGTDILELFKADRRIDQESLACLFVDEVQFLEPEQIDQLFEIAVLHDTPVIAYGLRSDFRTHFFPGSRRLMELAHVLEELITVCRCGKKAKFNGRKINGVFVSEGEAVAIDGKDAEYESLCPQCFWSKVGPPKAQ